MNIDFNALRPKLVQILGEQTLQNILLATQLEQMAQELERNKKVGVKADGNK